MVSWAPSRGRWRRPRHRAPQGARGPPGRSLSETAREAERATPSGGTPIAVVVDNTDVAESSREGRHRGNGGGGYAVPEGWRASVRGCAQGGRVGRDTSRSPTPDRVRGMDGRDAECRSEAEENARVHQRDSSGSPRTRDHPRRRSAGRRRGAGPSVARGAPGVVPAASAAPGRHGRRCSSAGSAALSRWYPRASVRWTSCRRRHAALR